MTNADKACQSTGVKEVYNRNEVEFHNLRRKKDKVKLKIMKISLSESVALYILRFRTKEKTSFANRDRVC